MKPVHLLLALSAFVVAAPRAYAQAAKDFSRVEIKGTRVSDKFYTLEGQGGMIGVLIGPDGRRDSAALVEESDVDYTILRPGWFTGDEAIDYQITQKGEAFNGHDVSLNSPSDLIAKLAASQGLYVRDDAFHQIEEELEWLETAGRRTG